MWLTAFGAGCARPAVEAAPEIPGEVVLQSARARAIPDRLRARFTVKIVSKALDIAGTTGGGLVVARPGRTRLELFGPMGGALLSVVSDGQALSVILAGPRRQLVSADAERVMRDATGGAAGLDEVFGLLVGDVPFDAAQVSAVRTVVEDEQRMSMVSLSGPSHSTVDVWLDPVTATPRQVLARDAKGKTVLAAKFDPFAQVGDAWMPTRIDVYVPAVDLSVEARYRDWVVLDAAPEVFGTEPVPGLSVESLEELVRSMAGKLKIKAD